MSTDLLPMTRSSLECYAYLSLVPSVCGSIGFTSFEQAFFTTDTGSKIWRYQASCPRCGETRQFTFPVSDEPQPEWPAFGGATPSLLLTPADFMVLGDRAASRAPADPAEADPDELEDAYEALAGAVACIEEVLKFPPHRYDRREVLAILGVYRKALAAYSRVVD